MKETLNRISKHEGVIGYMLFKISGGKIVKWPSRVISFIIITGIPIKTTLSHDLTNQYGYLATSIIKEVLNNVLIAHDTKSSHIDNDLI